MPKIVAAFVRAEVLETGTEERPARLAAATACGANEGLELREAELDGSEVRAIGWQVPEGGPGGLEGALDAGDLVGPEIVGDDNVAGLQGRHQDLVDVGAEALAIDRAVEDRRCCMNTLWGWGRASWAGCGPDVRRGGHPEIDADHGIFGR